jgi:hypothetical protein
MPANRDEIGPGEVSPGTALVLAAAVATAYRTETEVRSVVATDDRGWPIQLTSVDTSYTPARAAWKLRTWDAQGGRIDHPNGRTGTVTASPAVLIGNGSVPPASLPLDTWGWPTRLIDDGAGASQGFQLEVDWNCACAAAGSGAGSGDGGTFVVSDCGNLSTVLTVSLTDGGGASGLDGTVIDLEWDGAAWTATGVVLRDSVTDWEAACVAGLLEWTWTETSSTGTARFTQGGTPGGGTFSTSFLPTGIGALFGIDDDPSVAMNAFVAEG